MSKFPLAIVVITIIIVAGGVFFFSKDQNGDGYSKPLTYEFYWGEGCTHCEKVEEFLSSWDKKDQISITKLEVFKNQDNAKKLLEAGNYCNLAQQEKGSVPLLVTPEGKCYLGDSPIIELLKTL